MARSRTRRAGILVPAAILLVLLAVLAGIIGVVWHFVTGSRVIVIPPSQQCIVTVNGTSASLDLEQSGNAAIIVAESIRRGLPPRAASIALATAMQESGLRNLDHGDRDSVGLFQQRPSQGWGSVSDLMNPWYSSGKFYDAMVKVPDWQTDAINDVAQKVQRSGVPDGYRKHETNARAFASSLTGQSPASLSCVNRATTPGNVKAVSSLLAQAFGAAALTANGQVLTVRLTSTTQLWAAAQLAMMTTGTSGVTQVSLDGRSWTNDGQNVATWVQAEQPAHTLTITVRS